MQSNKERELKKKKPRQPNKRRRKYEATPSLGKGEKALESLPEQPLAETELGASPRHVTVPQSLAAERTLGNQKGFQRGRSEREEGKLGERPPLWAPANAMAGARRRRTLLPALAVSVSDAFVGARHGDAASFPLQSPGRCTLGLVRFRAEQGGFLRSRDLPSPRAASTQRGIQVGIPGQQGGFGDPLRGPWEGCGTRSPPGRAPCTGVRQEEAKTQTARTGIQNSSSAKDTDKRRELPPPLRISSLTSGHGQARI